MIYDYKGNEIKVSSSTSESKVVNASPKIMRGIAHRGYNPTAPENTIPAYVLAKKMGFDYAECDVSFTSDGVAVLLHDDTIDRTSNGSGKISAMTYEEALTYDYGSWKSADYTGTKIPTFEEFIRVCKELQLHPYIELKSNGSYTEAQIKNIVQMVKSAGMNGNVTYLSFNATYLQYVKKADPTARLGYVIRTIDNTVISTALNLQTGSNDVFLMGNYLNITDIIVNLCNAYNLPIEVWCPNEASWIENMNPYITGVTSDSLNAEKVLLEKHISEEEN